MPYYGHIYYGYGDFLANNLYVLLLIPVLLLSLWAQFQVSGSFRRYNAVNNRRRITGAQAAEVPSKHWCCGLTGYSVCLSGPAGEI